MPRQSTKTKAPKSRMQRGDQIVQLIETIRLLVTKPHTPVELTQKLDISRSSVQRLLKGLERGGLKLIVHRDVDLQKDARYAHLSLDPEQARKKLPRDANRQGDARYVYYSLDPEQVKKKFGLDRTP